MWYSTDGQLWQLLSGADSAIDQEPGAVVNDIVSTASGVFAGGVVDTDGNRLVGSLVVLLGRHPLGGRPRPCQRILRAAATTSSPPCSDIGATGTSVPGAPTPSGLLAVGGVRVGLRLAAGLVDLARTAFRGARLRRASRSTRSRQTAPGRSLMRVGGSLDHLFAVGGSPRRQRLWQSSDGLAWSEVPLPPPATSDQSWHIGLVAATGQVAVLADNLPGQPYVLVHRNGAWYQPSADGIFGQPQPTAVPTSLVDDDGTLVMSVELYDPGQRLGYGTSSVAVLTSEQRDVVADRNERRFRRVALSTSSCRSRLACWLWAPLPSWSRTKAGPATGRERLPVCP